MTAFRFSLFRAGLLLAAGAATAGLGVSAAAQVAPAPYREDPASALTRHLTALSQQPRSMVALMGAGKAALELGDPQAALTFFARAEEVAPRDGRVKAGMGSAFVQMEQPAAALKFFNEAAALGVGDAAMAKDRGLAYDLTGDPRRAQADYATALRHGEDSEVRERLALSLAISGDREAALAAIEALVRKQDRSAWRTRAFVLALTGDAAGATAAAQAVMPAQAAQLSPFFAKLPALNPAQRAMAVHFGRFPADGQAIQMAAVVPQPNSPAATTAAGRPDAGQSALGRPRTQVPEPVSNAPRGRPGGSRVTSLRERMADRRAATAPTAVPARARRQAASPAPPPATPASGGAVTPSATPPNRTAALAPSPAAPTPQPQPQPQPQTQPQPQPQPMPAAPVASDVRAPQQVAVRPEQQPELQRPSLAQPEPQPQSQAQAQASPAPQRMPFGPPTPGTPPTLAELIAASRAATEPPHSTATPGFASVASAIAAIPDPLKPATAETQAGEGVSAAPAPAKPKPAGAEATAAEAVKKAPPAAKPAPKAKPEPAKPAPKKKAEPAKPSEPSRIWVQIAGGANADDLPKAFARLKAKAPKLIGSHSGWTTPLRATNRLLVGPFKSEKEAQAFVNDITRAGLSGFSWTSPEGQKITKLPTK